MTYTYNDDRLTVTADADDRAELAQLKADDPDGFGSDEYMFDFFEGLMANSELDWIDPFDTGDLTDAPILGILGSDREFSSGPFGSVPSGFWNNHNWYRPILRRWGFMDYAVRSMLDDLLDRGEAVLVASS